MRLICPNCSAQYEIDASLIPDEGRDVQCSNCGHTWFELPPPPADTGPVTLEEEAPVVTEPSPGGEEAEAATEEVEAPEAEEVTETIEAEETEPGDGEEEAEEDRRRSFYEEDRGWVLTLAMGRNWLG